MTNEMRIKTAVLAVISISVLFAATLSAQVASGGQYSLDQAVIGGGGAQNSAGGQFAVDGTIGQSVAGQRAMNGSLSAHAGFWSGSDLSPSAAGVAVAGRVQTSDGNGIRNAIVTLAGSSGDARSALTGPFGYFQFDDVEAGGTYILTVNSKRYQFSQPTRILTVSDVVVDIIFTAIP